MLKEPPLRIGLMFFLETACGEIYACSNFRSYSRMKKETVLNFGNEKNAGIYLCKWFIKVCICNLNQPHWVQIVEIISSTLFRTRPFFNFPK